MSAHAFGISVVALDHASGTRMVFTMGALRPERTINSNTASRAALSLDPEGTTGFTSSAISPNADESMRISWLRSQFRLPFSVLISPLWANVRNGCASHHWGNVLVE